jgi:hypothetical protein
MTIRRHTTHILALAAMGALLQGCAPKPSGPAVRLFEADFKSAAKTCQTPKPDTIPGKTIDASMKVSSDGGWCGLSVANGGRPFDAELLTAAPAHGKVYVHRVGNDTRIDYTPEAGFTGADAFTVQLLPNDASVHVGVTAVAH